MLIPLTPIAEAWGESPFESESITGYSRENTLEQYGLPSDYVPNNVDVSINNKEVIKQLLPISNVKRTNIITELLQRFFETETNSDKIVSSNNPMSNGPPERTPTTPPSSAFGSGSQTEFFRNNGSRDISVNVILISLLFYILIDKLMIVWNRS